MTKDDIVAYYAAGTLVGQISRRFDDPERASFDAAAPACVAAHNEGLIDFLLLVEGDEFAKLSPSDFFVVQYFFQGVIPHLDTSVDRMMRAVDILVRRGGTDMAANQPNGAFRAWCASDSSRANKVIAEARAGNALATTFLTFALEATGALDEARAIALAYPGSRRLSAITALGRIPHPDAVSVSETVKTLLRCVDEDDDMLRGTVVLGVLSVLSLSGSSPDGMAVAIVKRAVAVPGENTQHACATALWVHTKVLNVELVTTLLDAITTLNPSNKGTVRELDVGLEALSRSGWHAEAISFLTRLLSAKGNGLQLSDFSSFSGALVAGPPERLGGLVVRWFLSGEPALCEGLSELLLRRSDRGTPLQFAAADLQMAPDAQIFLCRKAIGYLFLQPVIAASVLVSVLRACNDDVAAVVQDLLVAPLLQNYGGDTSGYLAGLDPADAAAAHAQSALKRNEAYLASIRVIPELKELQPSEHERQVEHIRASEEMRRAFKKAQTGSVFLNLVKRSVILHGNRSIAYVSEGADGPPRAIEMDLHAHGVSIDLPRSEVVDPVGLNYALLVYRLERMAS